MEIAVDGWRSGVAEWRAARTVPAEHLPRLTDEQREVARKLGISEEDYARSAFAGEQTREALLQKTERLAKVLARKLQESAVRVTVTRVVLRTVEHRFDVELQFDGRFLPLRIDETLVDDYFQGGSVEAEQSLGRILDRALVSITA